MANASDVCCHLEKVDLPGTLIARANKSSFVSPPADTLATAKKLGLGDRSRVRLHTGPEADAAAAAVCARAFTWGQDVHFANGEYAPDTAAGQRLLGHELAHTKQQEGGTYSVQAKLWAPEAGDTAEYEADSYADAHVDDWQIAAGLAPKPTPQNAGKTQITLNAFMVVKAYRGSKKLKSWSGACVWDGDPDTYVGAVKNGHIRWTNGKLGEIRVETNADGLNGKSLSTWLPRGTSRVVVSVRWRDSHYGSKAGTGGTRRKTDKTGNGAGSAGAERNEGSSSGGTEKKGTALEPSGGNSRAGREGTSPDGSGTVDEGSGRVGVVARGGQRGGPDRSGEAGRVHGGGLKRGGPGGIRGGSTREEGGQSDGYDPRPGGEKFGDPEGARGGEGKHGEHGIRGGGGLWGGLIGVPRAWRAAVEVAVIAGSATSPGAVFRKIASRGIRAMTTAAVRDRIQKLASKFADQEVKALSRRYAKTLARMPAQKRADVLKVTRDRVKREYFKMAEKGAKQRVRALTAQMANKPSRSLRRKLNDARKIEDAARVKPVGGQLPINHKFAGGTLKKQDLDPSNPFHAEAIEILEKYRRAGVKFTREGFPDFSPFVYRRSGVAADVRIKYTLTKHSKDYAAADRVMQARMAKRGKTWKRPEDHTWHHTERVTAGGMGQMVLVPTSLHRSVPHTGGIAVYKQLSGNIHAYPKN